MHPQRQLADLGHAYRRYEADSLEAASRAVEGLLAMAAEQTQGLDAVQTKTLNTSGKQAHLACMHGKHGAGVLRGGALACCSIHMQGQPDVEAMHGRCVWPPPIACGWRDERAAAMGGRSSFGTPASAGPFMAVAQDIRVTISAVPTECAGAGGCPLGLWGLKTVRALEAWEAMGSSIEAPQAFVGAVVDSGVDHNHPDLVGHTLRARSRTFVTGETGNNDGSDINGHGGLRARLSPV
jgi:hypothetical protein